MSTQNSNMSAEVVQPKVVDSMPSSELSAKANLNAESTVALSSPPDSNYKGAFAVTDTTSNTASNPPASDVSIVQSNDKSAPVANMVEAASPVLDAQKSPSTLAAEGKIHDATTAGMLENFSVGAPTTIGKLADQIESTRVTDSTAVKSSDAPAKSISVELENKNDPSSQRPNFVINSKGQIEMKIDPEAPENKGKNISIVVARQAGQINPTKEQMAAADELVTYLSKRAHGQGEWKSPITLKDKDNLVSRTAEQKAGLLPPKSQEAFTPQTREQVGNLNRFNGSHGVDMPSASSDNFGSFKSRSVERQLNESDKQAALKEVAAGLFQPDEAAPYDTIRQSPDGVVHYGRYGLSVDQISSFFDSLGDLSDPAHVAELVRTGKLPKDFAEKLKDPKFLAKLKESMTALHKGSITPEAMREILPKELQESIATDLVDKLKGKIGDRPGAIGAAFISGKSAENITAADLSAPQAVEASQAGDKLYQLATNKMRNEARMNGNGSDTVVGVVPEGERKALISEALKLAGQEITDANLAAVNTIIEKESGWDAKAFNGWDSNAEAGTPSQGLMQTIPSTFQENAIAGYNSDITDPLSNIIAGVRYAVGRYGSLQNVPGIVKLASGQDYVGY